MCDQANSGGKEVNRVTYVDIESQDFKDAVREIIIELFCKIDLERLLSNDEADQTFANRVRGKRTITQLKQAGLIDPDFSLEDETRDLEEEIALRKDDEMIGVASTQLQATEAFDPSI